MSLMGLNSCLPPSPDLNISYITILNVYTLYIYLKMNRLINFIGMKHNYTQHTNGQCMTSKRLHPLSSVFAHMHSTSMVPDDNVFWTET